MPTLFRRYDETLAREEYMQHLKNVAATQDLSQDTRQRSLGLTIGFTVFATVVVAMRFLARRRQGAAIMVDDWLTVVCLLLLYGNMAINIALINIGVGLHTGSLTYDQLAAMNKALIGAEILYFTGVNMFKIALLFLFFRIFPTPTVRKYGFILGGISTGWNVACTFCAIFQCLPQEKLWKPWLQGGCIDLFLTQLCVSVPVILLDICILLLPLPQVWRLNMNRTQRVFLTIIFLLGSYVVFTSIYRFVIFLGYNNDDNSCKYSYTLGDGIAWNIIEISSGIISGCLPTLGPLIRPIFKGLTSITTMKSKYGRPSNAGYSKDARCNTDVATGGHGGGSRHTRNQSSFGLTASSSNAHFGSGEMFSGAPADDTLELDAISSHTRGASGDEYHGSLDFGISEENSRKDSQIDWVIHEIDEGGTSESHQTTTK
ncbi:hypothetical protein MCOR21_007592 [Pyricularia oryzae]|uniref:Rhodopsin domain-containing protein n=1 Tax=Pyricularia grisea TaxID=148305 RepID=A0ABQ8NKK1_PYRGI|nr:hypothetical protein MCOR33_006372 [Pyricularia grisea]KAI6424668.1 hypothetical protein MCOR21_007592 [Pyricularia oryzae]KAI6472461.1 hypothetical protein MCOR15_000430 [Pyricularia oryzae]KAI6488692.1 hypothetical protein MCOR18_002820 [Pyricularia oryzae]KAI6538831.1 hypothetical protein MCOR16_001588 [Pyricularia oryzae]